MRLSVLLRILLILMKTEDMESKEVEIWKDIPGYEGLYQCSNFGNVMTLRKFIPVSQSLTSSGYLTVNLRIENFKSHSVHVLVAMTFLDHVPCGRHIVVDHIDNNKLNNHVWNLQVITHRKNCSKDKNGGASEYVGVNLHKSSNKWQSRILIGGKRKFLGYFKTEIEASNAYQNELKKLNNK